MIRPAFLMILALWLSCYTLTSHALTASTANFIVGNPPHFNTPFEQEIAEGNFSLLKFNYLSQVYPNRQAMPLLDSHQTIQQFTQRVTLSPIILI